MRTTAFIISDWQICIIQDCSISSAVTSTQIVIVKRKLCRWIGSIIVRFLYNTNYITFIVCTPDCPRSFAFWRIAPQHTVAKSVALWETETFRLYPEFSGGDFAEPLSRGHEVQTIKKFCSKYIFAIEIVLTCLHTVHRAHLVREKAFIQLSHGCFQGCLTSVISPFSYGELVFEIPQVAVQSNVLNWWSWKFPLLAVKMAKAVLYNMQSLKLQLQETEIIKLKFGASLTL